MRDKNKTRAKTERFLAVQERLGSRVSTYGIKDILKLNGFRWFKPTKSWAIDIAHKATAMNLLESMNVANEVEISEMSFDELVGKVVTEKVIRKNYIPAKALTTLGVDRRALDRKIQAGKLSIKNFQLDAIGRKINKRFSRQHVIREYPDLTDRLSA